jgi:hypothetical protein
MPIIGLNEEGIGREQPSYIYDSTAWLLATCNAALHYRNYTPNREY